jgi:hypothetical protein
LIKQYVKSVEYLILWTFANLDFKLREPKKNWIYSFRINK